RFPAIEPVDPSRSRANANLRRCILCANTSRRRKRIPEPPAHRSKVSRAPIPAVQKRRATYRVSAGIEDSSSTHHEIARDSEPWIPPPTTPRRQPKGQLHLAPFHRSPLPKIDLL